jgi:DNA-3-methyladenine glycosylase
VPHAVLIRALQPTRGLALWREARPDLPLERIASGPGRLCRALGLDRSHDGLDLGRSALTLLARPAGFTPGAIRAGPRIGIRLAREAPYRLWLAGEAAVSGPSGRRPVPRGSMRC